VVDQSNTSKSAKSNSSDLLKIAQQRFKLAVEAHKDIHQDFIEDLKFRSGEQWPTEMKNDRFNDGRPCLVINRIPQFVKQITNDQRQNRPSIKVYPVDDQGDPETAKILQGLIKHIEYNSQADTAYDTAFESAVTGGLGYFRIVTDYADTMSFDQEILIKRIRNPLMVLLDPGSTEPDGSDASFGFIFEDLLPDEYKDLYPNSDLASMQDWESLGASAPDWMPSGSVRVAEYFYKEFKEKTIHLLSNGQVAEDGIPLAPGVTVKKSRQAMVPVVKWCKLNAVEVLEEREWIGQWIPIVKVIGEELDVDGKVVLKGVVRDAKDPQRMYNYWKSTETETIALAPRAPWVGVEGQFTGHEAKWKTAHKKPHAYLEYKNVSLNGVPAPPPQRQTFEPAIQAITMASREAADDIKATTGIYDASLGAQARETSGIAIQRRNNQAQTSNFHFVDNLTRSLRHAGRIIIDLIPKIYDTPRAARIIGEDGEQEIVYLNKLFQKDGKDARFDVGIGKYDVVVQTGPSYATKRQEAAQSMLEMSKANPAVMQLAGDLMVKAMDWPMHEEVAERLKKALPPGIADDGKDQPLPPQVQQQLQQQGEMIKQLSDAVHKAHDVIDQKKLELESRERIEFAKLDTQKEIALAQLGSREGLALLEHQVAEIQHRYDTLVKILPHELALQQPIEAAPEEQDPGMMAQPQGSAPMPQMPTGGLSPGQPMEGTP